MRLAFAGASGAVLLWVLAGCGGRATTLSGTGGEPADRGTKVGKGPTKAAEGSASPPSGIDDPQPILSTPSVPGGIGGGTGAGDGNAAAGRPAGTGTPETAAGAGGSTGAGEDRDPATGDSTVPLAGPHAAYVVATFVSSLDAWLGAESILADHAAVPAPDGATTAAALVSSSGALVDAAVSTCGSRPVGNPSVRSVPTDYATIQEALDAAGPGDTVAVAAGVYTEHLRLPSYVKLLGAGASTTILDGQNQGGRLIDFTGATAAVVSGFTLRNVARGNRCGGDYPTECSGNWYSAAVYADGHDEGCGSESSLFFTRNIVIDNDIGFLLYFLASAVVTNNIFVRNQSAFVANHHQDHALVAQNVFYENRGVAITAQASYLSVIGNILAENGTAFSQEAIQRGFVGCNVLSPGDSRGDGEGEFTEVAPDFYAPEALDFRLAESSLARGLGCNGPNHLFTTDPGAFGGPLGNWSP